jgi:periplasmic copper chaperone A
MRLHKLFPIAAAIALGACQQTSDERQVEVEEAWVRLPAVQGRPGAGYFVLRSYAPRNRLLSVTSESAERIELHDNIAEGGMNRMVPLEDTALPERTEVAFEPGGKHAMLFGLDPSLEPGGRIELTFNFETTPPITVRAEVVAPGATTSGDAGHGH